MNPLEEQTGEPVVTETEMDDLIESAFPSLDAAEPEETLAPEPELEQEPELEVPIAGEDQASSIAKKLYEQMREDLIGGGTGQPEPQQAQPYRNPVLDIPDEDLTVEQLVVKTQLKAAEYVSTILTSRSIVDNIFNGYEVDPNVSANINSWIASADPGTITPQAVESAAYYALGQGIIKGTVKPKAGAEAAKVAPVKRTKSVGAGLPSMGTSHAGGGGNASSSGDMPKDEAAFRRVFGSDFSEEEIASMFK